VRTPRRGVKPAPRGTASRWTAYAALMSYLCADVEFAVWAAGFSSASVADPPGRPEGAARATLPRR
jgi:hypothetical protein